MAKIDEVAQAELEAVIAEARELRRQQQIQYRTAVVDLRDAVPVESEQLTVRNWIARDNIEFDGSEREKSGRLKFSPRDVLLVHFALRLSKCGMSPVKAKSAIDEFSDVIAELGMQLAIKTPYFACVSPEGEIVGFMPPAQVASVELGGFILIRLDLLIKESLEPLGYAMTYGSAKELRAKADELEKAEKQRRSEGS